MKNHDIHIEKERGQSWCGRTLMGDFQTALGYTTEANLPGFIRDIIGFVSGKIELPAPAPLCRKCAEARHRAGVL